MSGKDTKENKANRRFIGKVKTHQGQFGEFQKILVDNPTPKNQDGSVNKYYRGSLVWLDHESGKKFLVKQLSFRGVSEQAAEKGFTSSVSIDLDNDFDVQELE